MTIKPSHRRSVVIHDTGAYECGICHARFDWTSTRPRRGGRPPKYCSEKCATAMVRAKQYVLRECAWCGHGFNVRKDLGTRACSQLCAVALKPTTALVIDLPWSHPARMAGRTTRCFECGDEFIQQSTASVYCSGRCSRRVKGRRRRAREYSARGSWRWVDFVGIFLAGDRRCAYCDVVITGQAEPDHVTPLSRGGSNRLSNLLPSCSACNAHKSDLTIDEWQADRSARGLSPVRTAFVGPRFRHFVPESAAGSSARAVRPLAAAC